MTIKTLPISTNRLYYGRKILTKEARENKEAMAWEMRAAWKGKPLEGNIKLTIDLYWPDNRPHDWDNLKALGDSGNGILWNDDSQIVEATVRKHVDRISPRIDLSVESI